MSAREAPGPARAIQGARRNNSRAGTPARSVPASGLFAVVLDGRSAHARNMLVFAGSCEEDPQRERELIGSFRERRAQSFPTQGESDIAARAPIKRSGHPMGRPDVDPRTLAAKGTLARRVLKFLPILSVEGFLPIWGADPI